uniref:Pyridoxamine 5'-phosphate oxidase family protein n=1 Tax=Desulfobacca acetoxidans TaxID=60893 RepID=A0A7V4LCT1_9BACT
MNPRELLEYFGNISGHGVLATADARGKVNQAVFARPHVMEDGTVAFIMPHRLTHKNLQENPHAAYLFMESGPGYQGKRLYLTKVREEQDTELLYSLRRRTYPAEKEKQEGPRFLVFFRVDQVLPLIGPGTKGA